VLRSTPTLPPPRTAPFSKRSPPGRAASQLARWHRPVAQLAQIGQAQDPKLIEELQDLRDSNATLSDRFQKLQVQCTSILSEKNDLKAQMAAMSQGGEEAAMLREQVERLQEEIDLLRQEQPPEQAPQSGVEALLEELRTSQEIVQEMTIHLEDARNELLAKMEKSKPFLNLRSMLNKKNVIVRQLREQLKANGIAAEDDVAAVDD